MKYSYLFLGVLSSFNLAMASEGSRINVSGNCIKTVIPDRASVQISAEVLEKTVGDASLKGNEFYNKMRDAVKKLNLKDMELETTQYSLFEQTEWQNNKSISKGFKAIIGLSVSTSETARIGEVIAQATKFPVARVGGLTNYVSMEKMNLEKESCLEVAVKNAKMKAEKIARAADVGLGKLESVQEEMSFAPPVAFGRAQFSMKAEMADAAGGAPPQIEAGAQKINVTVQAGFAVK